MLLFFPNINFAQAPDLGSAADFVLFSATGAVGNTGISQLTGNVGTNNGAITGFGNVNGVMHNADVVTAQCLTDLQAAWYQLDTMSPTSVHGPVLGNGETLYAGVYSIAAAGSLVSFLTLDAQGDSGAVFIIKTGGAFTTAATSTIYLINGALACNVFWKAEGAIGLAALTTMRGTLVSHNGAISTGDGTTLEGRALSTTGAVTVYGTLAYMPVGCGSPHLRGPVSPILACTACFKLFSSDGQVTNTGITYVAGDIGTNVGLTSGYNPLFVTGYIHQIPDVPTAQCASDLLNVYNYLKTRPYDIELLYPAQFGNKLVLTPHTYLLNAATALTDTLYLNAQGDSTAVFVIQINGALSTSVYSKVKLINQALGRNVYWVVEGAVSINNYSIFCGTVICNNGAIVLSTGVTLDGRAFTTTGALSTSGITAITSDQLAGCSCSVVLPIELISFTDASDKEHVVLKWSTATETNNDYFTVQRSRDGVSFEEVLRVRGAGNSVVTLNYMTTDIHPFSGESFYRLKQTDFNGTFKYSNITTVDMKDRFYSRIYPNPSGFGKTCISIWGIKAGKGHTMIYDATGKETFSKLTVFEATGIQNIEIEPSPQLVGGVYFVIITTDQNTYQHKLVIN